MTVGKREKVMLAHVFILDVASENQPWRESFSSLRRKIHVPLSQAQKTDI